MGVDCSNLPGAADADSLAGGRWKCTHTTPVSPYRPNMSVEGHTSDMTCLGEGANRVNKGRAPG
jgi:hypothetical protein